MAIRQQLFEFLKRWVDGPTAATTLEDLEEAARRDRFLPVARDAQLDVLRGLREGTLVEVPVYRHDHRAEPPVYRAGADAPLCTGTVILKGSIPSREGVYHMLVPPPIGGYGYVVTLREEEPAVRVHRAYQARTVGYAWGTRGGKPVVLKHDTVAFHSHTGPVIRGVWLPLVAGDGTIVGLLALRAEETRYRIRSGIASTYHIEEVATPPAPSGWVLSVQDNRSYLVILPDNNR